MKTLVLITSQFPFGRGEPFIGAELSHLEKSFSRIIIIAQNATDKKTRETAMSVLVKRWDPATGVIGFFLIPLLVLLDIRLITDLISDELSFRKQGKRKTGLKELLFLLRKIIKAVQLKNFITRTLKREKIKENIVFYSYWLKTGAHAISLLNYRKSIKISRAHGSDLYEEKTEKGYLPLQKSVAERLDAIFFISHSGLKYFSEKTGNSENKFFISYLGTENKYGIEKNITSHQDIIVSCSNLIPLKRVHLIIEALHLLKQERNLLWIHYGDGNLRNELEKLAAEKLSDGRIMYKFMGHVPNADVLRFYLENKVSLFINTSTTEGIPVSMMEAQSAGIPILATDTGGVSEIVVEGTGSLLPVDFLVPQLAEKIRYYLALDDKQEQEIRRNALLNWRNKFNASVNYTKFVESINNIFESSQ